MNDQIITLIHYGELSLKGKNRSLFENKLKENIERETGGKVTKYRGRFVLEDGDPGKLKNVFGISWYAEAIRVDKDYESIKEQTLSQVNDELPGKSTFGVFVKRSDKSFPYTSMELENKIGSEISKTYSIEVNLKSPELSVFIEIADDVYIYFHKTQGLKGLPVDVSGNVLSLLSGGIDSPVASYLMMKRGCRVNNPSPRRRAGAGSSAGCCRTRGTDSAHRRSSPGNPRTPASRSAAATRHRLAD